MRIGIIIFNEKSVSMSMTRISYPLLLLAVCVASCARPTCKDCEVEATAAINPLLEIDSLQDGDIIFQTSASGQSKAIQIATGSKYSHMGIVCRQDEGLMVYEAIQPVKLTPLNDWIARGMDGHYVVKRLKNAEEILTPETVKQMKTVGNEYLNKDYDIYFEWSDEKIYCSELVWKIYKKSTGIEIGELDKLSNFNLSDPIVRQKIEERFGNNLPLNETVISPSAMFDSDKLVTVMEK